MSKSKKNKKIKNTKSKSKSKSNHSYKNDRLDKFLKKQDKIIERMKKKSKIRNKSELYVALLFTTIINGSLIYYLNYLEGENCKCDINWEHHYIKYFAILIIINSIITIYYYKSMIKHDNNKDMDLFKIILVVTSILYAYLLFKYFGRVNNKKETSEECNKCATEDLKSINIFFYYYRYLYLLLLIVFPIIIILIIVLYKIFY